MLSLANIIKQGGLYNEYHSSSQSAIVDSNFRCPLMVVRCKHVFDTLSLTINEGYLQIVIVLKRLQKIVPYFH